MPYLTMICDNIIVDGISGNLTLERDNQCVTILSEYYDFWYELNAESSEDREKIVSIMENVALQME